VTSSVEKWKIDGQIDYVVLWQFLQPIMHVGQTIADISPINCSPGSLSQKWKIEIN